MFAGRDWSEVRWFEVGAAFLLAWLLSFSLLGVFVPTVLAVVEVGLTNGWRPLSDVNLEWWRGFVVVEVQLFESTMVLLAIWSSDRATISWQLLVTEGLLVWTDVEGFEARKRWFGRSLQDGLLVFADHWI